MGEVCLTYLIKIEVIFNLKSWAVVTGEVRKPDKWPN